MSQSALHKVILAAADVLRSGSQSQLLRIRGSSDEKSINQYTLYSKEVCWSCLSNLQESSLNIGILCI